MDRVLITVTDGGMNSRSTMQNHPSAAMLLATFPRASAAAGSTCCFSRSAASSGLPRSATESYLRKQINRWRTVRRCGCRRQQTGGAGRAGRGSPRPLTNACAR